jgi:hypothetical protein
MDVAVVYICIDRAVDEPHIYYAIQTIRRSAKYRGPIYVVTDRGEDFLKKLKTKGEDLVEMVTPLPPLDLSAAYAQILKNRFYFRTQMRLQKTRVLDIVPTHIQSIVYMDADILTLGEACVDEFVELNVYAEWADDEDISMSCYTDNSRIRGTKTIDHLGGDGRWNLHAGTFVVKRNRSEDILRRWHDSAVDSDALDRFGLVRALWNKYPDASEVNMSSSSNQRCRHVRPFHAQKKFLPGDHFMYPQNELGLYLPQTCMLHVSYGRCNHLGKEYIDKVLGSVVPGYKDDYCPMDPLGLSRANVPGIEVSYMGMFQACGIFICIVFGLIVRRFDCKKAPSKERD